MTNSEAVGLLMNSQYYERGYKQGVTDVLNKISAEIEQLREDYKAYWEMEEANALDNALTILNKYKAESEG